MVYNGGVQVRAVFVVAQACGTSTSKVQAPEECHAPGPHIRTLLVCAGPWHGLSAIPPARNSSPSPRPERREHQLKRGETGLEQPPIL